MSEATLGTPGHPRSLARALVDRLSSDTTPSREIATVVSVQAAGAAPGNLAYRTLTLAVCAGFSQISQVRFLDSYTTPATGDKVILEYCGSDPLVIGRLAV